MGGIQTWQRCRGIVCWFTLANYFPSSQFREKNIPEVEGSLCFFKKCKSFHCFLPCRAWAVKTLQNFCPCLFFFMTSSCLYPILLSLVSPSWDFLTFCPLCSLMPPPPSKQPNAPGAPVVQTSAGSGGLVVEGCLWLQPWRSRIPL